MINKKVRSAALFLAIQLVLAVPVLAQRTTPQQDIDRGRALSQDVNNTFIPSEDAATQRYVQSLGNELASHAPGYRYPYEFHVFIDSDSKSMALPGGFIYVSSGLVMALQNEPELAAMLAHQIAHVALGHGGNTTNFKYNATEEQQADQVAAQILFDSRFNPTVLPTVFQQLEREPDDSAREFLMNHPAQTNRLSVVRREMQRFGPTPGAWRGDSVAFRSAQDALRGETPFGLANRDNRDQPLTASSRMTTYRGTNFDIDYPDNWRVDDRGNGVMIAPENGVVNGSLAYGMLMNTFNPDTRSNLFGRNSFNVPGGIVNTTNVSTATDQLIDSLRQSNPNMRVVRRTQKRVGGFDAMTVELNNDSPLGGTEVDVLTAVLHSDGSLYYFMGVAPQADINQYSPIFDRMIASIRFY